MKPSVSQTQTHSFHLNVIHERTLPVLLPNQFDYDGVFAHTEKQGPGKYLS